MIAGQNYSAFLETPIDWYGILVSYIGIPIFVCLWLGYKWVHKTRMVRLADCRFGLSADE